MRGPHTHSALSEPSFRDGWLMCLGGLAFWIVMRLLFGLNQWLKGE